jgi:hypothetical protein
VSGLKKNRDIKNKPEDADPKGKKGKKGKKK